MDVTTWEQKKKERNYFSCLSFYDMYTIHRAAGAGAGRRCVWTQMHSYESDRYTRAQAETQLLAI